MFYHCTICAFEVSTLTRVAVDVYLILRWKSDTNIYYKNLGNFCKTLLILYLHRDHHFFRCISLRVSLFLIEWQLNRECESAINCLFLCGSDTLSTSFWCFFFKLIFCEWMSVSKYVLEYNIHVVLNLVNIIVDFNTEWLEYILKYVWEMWILFINKAKTESLLFTVLLLRES